MKTYKVTRKYALKQFENIDLGVEGLENAEDISKEVEKFDLIVKDIKEKANKCCDAFPECNHSQPIKEPTKLKGKIPF